MVQEGRRFKSLESDDLYARVCPPEAAVSGCASRLGDVYVHGMFLKNQFSKLPANDVVAQTGAITDTANLE